MAISYEQIKILSLLTAAQQPILQAQSGFVYAAPNGKPTLATEGIATLGALASWVGVRMSQESERFASFLRLDSFDITTIYTLNGWRDDPGNSGWLLNVSAEADAPDTLAAIKALLDVDAEFIAYAGASEVLSTPADILKFTVDRTTVNKRALNVGAGTASIISDARMVLWRVWGLPLWYTQNLGIGPAEWELIDDGQVYVSPGPVARDIVCSAGYTRIYVEILAADGLALPVVGPTAAEGTSQPLSTKLQAAWSALQLIEPAKLLFPTALNTNEDIVDFGAVTVTNQAVVGAVTFGAPIVWPGSIEPPFRLPAFDLRVKNNGPFPAFLHQDDVLDSVNMLEIVSGQTKMFGPFALVDKPWQFSAPAGGAGASDIDVTYEIVWR